MREPVPDRVAQDFFKELVLGFNHNQQDLSFVINQARQYLQTLEHIYPCSSSLPLLFHNASVKPLTWQKLPGYTKTPPLQIHQTQKLTETGRKIPEIALPKDYINISFIGDRASGKTTYIASLIRNPNPPKTSIINSICDLDDKARQLEYLVRKRIEKGEVLEPNNPSNLAEIHDYRLKMRLKKSPSLWGKLKLFSSKSQLEEFEFNLRDYNGQFFNSLDRLDEDNTSLIQDCPQSWTQSTGIMLAIAITENQKDIRYEQKIDELLTILDNERSERKCQRIAVVLTKCDRSETFSSYKSLTPQKLAAKYFPRVSYKLQKWEEISHGELGYFSTSAFGFLGEFNSKANVKRNGSNQDVLDRVQCWRPVNLIAPIYWLATGKTHHELNDLSQY